MGQCSVEDRFCGGALVAESKVINRVSFLGVILLKGMPERQGDARLKNRLASLSLDERTNRQRRLLLANRGPGQQ